MNVRVDAYNSALAQYRAAEDFGIQAAMDVGTGRLTGMDMALRMKRAMTLKSDAERALRDAVWDLNDDEQARAQAAAEAKDERRREKAELAEAET